MSTNSNHQAARVRPAAPAPVIRETPLSAGTGDSLGVLRFIAVYLLMLVIHLVMLAGFFVFFMLTGSAAAEGVEQVKAIESRLEEDPKELDLTNPDIGMDIDIPLAYDVKRIEPVSVPGEVNPTQAPGIENAPAAAMTSIPPPPGLGIAGQGGGIDSSVFGKAPSIGFAGGAGGFRYVPGGFNGRSGSTREQIALQGGGSKESEAAVAMALEWLALHQADDGHWSIDGFHQHAHDKIGAGAKRFTCNCAGPGARGNDIAGTAFGLLPFLAAGQTHRPSGARGGQRDYAKNVENGLKYLMSKQGKDGNFGGGMYAHGLASIAMCEAFGMTSDPLLKLSAQRALDYIIYAQDTRDVQGGGGWRYGPKQPGDTSVVGWQVMALKSGQMSGLSVPTPTLNKAMSWLDHVMDQNSYGYGYTSARATPTMTSVGLLCRQYLGWGPRKAELIKGVETMAKTPPGKANNMYYYYYATQVMHHMGGDSWQQWNEGDKAKGVTGMRDLLIAKQDKGTDPKHPHHRGSWSPAGDAHGSQGGRLMITSLSVLTLEVYYRHLPLYRRDLGGNKELEDK